MASTSDINTGRNENQMDKKAGSRSSEERIKVSSNRTSTPSRPSNDATTPSSHREDYFLFRAGESHHEYLFRTDEQPPSLFKASLASSLWLAMLTYWASFQVAFVHLISFETLIVSGVSAASVVFYSLVTPAYPDEPLVAKLSLSFMSFIIVFPITANIGYAFVRREKALQTMAAMKTYVFNIYIAHRDWAFDAAKSHKCRYSARNIINVKLDTTSNVEQHTDVQDKGDKDDNDVTSTTADDESNSNDDWNVWGGAVSQQHVDEVRHVLIKMIRAMRDYLALPLASRNRHFYTSTGRQTRARVQQVQQACLQDFYEQFQRLSLAVERMKEAGMPGNEAARINQYHSLFLKEWEMTRFIKSYRTPTGLRAFARIYILMHPLFVGPYYSWVAGAGRDREIDDWPFQTSLAFAIALAIFTAVAMQGLFNVEVGLEDPFDESEGLDNLRVGVIFREMERLLCMEWADEGWNDAVMRGEALYNVPFRDDYGCKPVDVPTVGLAQAMESLRRDSNPLSCACLPRSQRGQTSS